MPLHPARRGPGRGPGRRAPRPDPAPRHLRGRHGDRPLPGPPDLRLRPRRRRPRRGSGRDGPVPAALEARGRARRRHGAADDRRRPGRGGILLGGGEGATLVLSHREDDDGDIGQAAASLSATERYWQEWSGRCTYEGRTATTSCAARTRAQAALTHDPRRDHRGRHHQPAGGGAGHPQLRLPLRLDADASFTVTAFVNLGYLREAAEFLRFLRDADGTARRDLELMYGINGAYRRRRSSTTCAAGAAARRCGSATRPRASTSTTSTASSWWRSTPSSTPSTTTRR